MVLLVLLPRQIVGQCQCLSIPRLHRRLFMQARPDRQQTGLDPVGTSNRVKVRTPLEVHRLRPEPKETVVDEELVEGKGTARVEVAEESNFVAIDV